MTSGLSVTRLGSSQTTSTEGLGFVARLRRLEGDSAWTRRDPYPVTEELPVICPMTSLYVLRANLMGELEWPRVDGTTGTLEVPIDGSRTG
jgi:hypothetical protein